MSSAYRPNCSTDAKFMSSTAKSSVRGRKGVRRILVRGVNAPLPPEVKKILKI